MPLVLVQPTFMPSSFNCKTLGQAMTITKYWNNEFAWIGKFAMHLSAVQIVLFGIMYLNSKSKTTMTCFRKWRHYSKFIRSLWWIRDLQWYGAYCYCIVSKSPNESLSTSSLGSSYVDGNCLAILPEVSVASPQSYHRTMICISCICFRGYLWRIILFRGVPLVYFSVIFQSKLCICCTPTITGSSNLIWTSWIYH